MKLEAMKHAGKQGETKEHFADCVMVKFELLNCDLCCFYFYNHDVTLTLYIN